jgi:hypothetical protein
MCTCVCRRVRMSLSECVCRCVLIHVCVCAYVQAFSLVLVAVHTRACAHTHIYTHMQTHTYTRTYTHTHTDTHTRAHTHTHRRMQAWRARYPGWLRSSLDLKQLYCSPTRLPCNCASRSANIRSNKRGKVFLKSQYPSTSTMYNHHNENFQELVPRAPVQDT